MPGYTQKHQRPSGRGNEGKMWGRVFIVVSVGKARQGRARIKIS